MKRLCMLLVTLLCLTGCSKTEVSPKYTPAYTASSATSEENTPLFQYLYGNSSLDIGIVSGDYQQGTPDICYLLDTQDGVVSSALLFSPKNISNARCLGVDGQDGIWFQGKDSQNSACIVRYDTSGKVLLNIDLGHQMPFLPVSGFSWDSASYYFLIQGNDDCWLIQYDLAGAEIFRRSLKDYYMDTSGYLPMEEDWKEDLEGRTDDRLLTILFPDGPINQLGLIQFQDGTIGMMIRRQSPIDGEAYNIICTLEDGCAKAVPRYYYALETEHSIQLSSYFPSNDPKYDLLVNQLSGLYGVNLQEETMDLLITWADAGYQAMNLSTYGTTPHVPPNACPGPGGTLWFYDRGQERNIFTLLTPVA